MDTTPVIIYALVQKDEGIYHVHTCDDTLNFDAYVLLYADMVEVEAFLSKCKDANPDFTVRWN